MRKLLPVFLMILFILPLKAQDQRNFRSYFGMSQYQQAAPGAFKYGLYGYNNPAILSYAKQSDILFAISNYGSNLENFNDWGFFMNAGSLGFGIVQEIDENGKQINDYRLSTGFGDRDFSLGMAYGWSNGAEGSYNREDVFILGGLIRPSEYFSTGISYTWALGGEDQEAVIDVAVRPFKNELLTLFGDFSIFNDQNFDAAMWSAGAVFEVLPGIRLNGRYFENESFRLGVNYSMGHSGVAGYANFAPDAGESAEYDNATFMARVGAWDRHLIKGIGKGRKYMVLDLSGKMKYQRGLFFGFFTEKANTFLSALQKIQHAEESELVGGIVVKTAGAAINREMLWEIRESLKRFKMSGKKVYVFLERAGIDMYHFASVADKVILDPHGGISISGYVLGSSYYKNMFEKVGIGIQELRYFKFKSAVEAFSREDMSEGQREQLQAIADGWYELARKEISASRGFSNDEFDELVNLQISYMPEEALDSKLIDKIERWPNLREVMKDLDVSFDGFIPYSQIDPANRPIDDHWSEPPMIAVIYALGACSMDDGISARSLVNQVEAAAKSDKVKAIVLRVDSPGGDAMASDYIAEVVREYKDDKPIIVSQGYVAASGGYWLSMDATKIVAAPNTITGSIGVIGMWIYEDGLKNDLGITTDNVKRGKYSDLGFSFSLPLIGLGLPDRKMTDDELQQRKDMIMELYKEFVTKVANGRGMEYDEVEKLARGRVWTGAAAAEIGLVDKIGGLMDAIYLAKAEAGLLGEEEINIIEMPGAKELGIETLVTDMASAKFPFKLDDKENKDLQFIKFLSNNNGMAMPIMPFNFIEEIPE